MSSIVLEKKVNITNKTFWLFSLAVFIYSFTDYLLSPYNQFVATVLDFTHKCIKIITANQYGSQNKYLVQKVRQLYIKIHDFVS